MFPLFFQVTLAFFARLGVMLASCINPFIYATTIPGFKAMVQNRMVRYGIMKGEVSPVTQMETSNKWSGSIRSFRKKNTSITESNINSNDTNGDVGKVV